MKVALVYPRYKWFEYNGLAEPLGVLHLVSALRAAGHEPVYLDYSFCDEIDQLDSLAKGCGIVAVAISAAAKLERASVVTGHLKTVVPDAFFAVGGAYPSIFPKKAVEDTGVTCAFLGEAEEAIVELADTIEKGESPDSIRNLLGRKLFADPATSIQLHCP